METQGHTGVDQVIAFLDRSTIPVQLREPNFPHRYKEYAETAPEEIVERLQGVAVAIVNKVPLREQTLKQLPGLKHIAVAATGTELIDKAYCKAHGITVSNIRGYSVNTLPEHVFALAFALRRNLMAYRDDVRTGRWQQSDQFSFVDYPIRDMQGSTLGIVGYGGVGQSLARIAKAFGLKVLAYDILAQPGLSTFETVLRESDIISLHVPLTPKTHNMIGVKELAMMKRDALLINTGRGGLVNEHALAHALKNGVLGGAGLDVLTVEPPKEGNILLDLKLPNLIITPHVAWASQEAMHLLAEQLIGNIEAFAAGTPKNTVEE
jgi:glycerate dehydrogenase